eukprot:263902-Prymnesium_polylepis.1
MHDRRHVSESLLRPRARLAAPSSHPAPAGRPVPRALVCVWVPIACGSTWTILSNLPASHVCARRARGRNVHGHGIIWVYDRLALGSVLITVCKP